MSGRANGHEPYRDQHFCNVCGFKFA